MEIRCLLLVDDDAEELATTAQKLAMTKLNVGEVVLARSLAQAISTIKARGVDIVLLDLDLGDSRSVDTLTAMRAVTDAVIIVLAGDDELLAAESLKLGADDYLVKSEMGEECLGASIMRNMNRRQMRRTVNRIGTKLQRLCQLVGVG